ncbi:MAG: hypothetical protein Q9180_009557 [Flavoplaca navasiana]
MITVNEQAANGKSTGSSLDPPGRYVPDEQVRFEPTNERDQPVAGTPAVAAHSFSEIEKHFRESDLTRSGAGEENLDCCSENWEKEIKEAAVLDAEEISQRLNVDLRHGLHSAEVASRLARDGPNKLEDAPGVSMWKILLRQVSNSLTLVSALSLNPTELHTEHEAA